jgi:hypothetical protein
MQDLLGYGLAMEGLALMEQIDQSRAVSGLAESGFPWEAE